MARCVCGLVVYYLSEWVQVVSLTARMTAWMLVVLSVCWECVRLLCASCIKVDVCCRMLHMFHVLQLLINLLLNLNIVFSINCYYHNIYTFTENMWISNFNLCD